MERALRAAADRLQRAAARSAVLVRLAVLVRNQCRCIIKYRLAESPDTTQTGEVWLRELLAPRCSTFVDVGANAGEWLEAIASHKRGQAYTAIAYEPSNSAFASLSGRFAGESGVTLRNCAAGDASGDFEFFEEEAAGKGSSLVAGFVSAAGSTRRVPVVRLDDDLASLGVKRIDFLKIDAEGYDMRVLAGASRLFDQGLVGAVQFEYNRAWQLAGDTLYAAMRFLQNYGYEVFVLKRDGLYTLDYRLYEEYFEYSNFVALPPAFADVKTQMYRGTI